jgi:signal transduction histidine kinase
LIHPSAAARARRVWNITLPDGRSGRAMSYLTVPANEDEDRDEHAAVNAATRPAAAKVQAVLVIVARSRGNVDEVLGELLTAMIIAAAVLICAAIVAVRYAIGRGLRPVNALAVQATRIGPETLDYRFDVNALPIELQPICLRLNDLLSRLDQAFKRERRLNADIAHELRTPIAELRALSEVAQRWPGDADQQQGYFRDAHEIGLRMESMVETLLALGRSQTRRSGVRLERVEIASLIEQVINALRERIDAKNIEIQSSQIDEMAIETDRVMIRRVMENLIGNAVEYTPGGGKIQCSVHCDNGRGTIRIGNTDDSLNSEDVAAMFEPFWRKDAARSGDAHAGLGLTLVAEYARQLGISLNPALREGWFEIALEMPCAAALSVSPR